MKKDPADQGGWSVLNPFRAGLDQFNPVGHVFLRGMGEGLGAGRPFRISRIASAMA